MGKSRLLSRKPSPLMENTQITAEAATPTPRTAPKAVWVAAVSWPRDRKVAPKPPPEKSVAKTTSNRLKPPTNFFPPPKGTLSRDTLRPCTVKQIVEATQPHPDADFKIDDVEIQQVTLVGQIRNISAQTTNITYKLDDGTGTVEVKQWVDIDATATSVGESTKPETKGLVVNEWVRVWGRLKALNNRRLVAAHVMRPLSDKMEIT
ncbi:MAG: hypothetical protein L6R39_006970, partial [Caloplaca ligustica]